MGLANEVSARQGTAGDCGRWADGNYGRFALSVQASKDAAYAGLHMSLPKKPVRPLPRSKSCSSPKT